MEITYTRVGDYLLPDIILQEKPPPSGYGEPLGRYARMRRAFLKEHRTILYNQLLLTERLYRHLYDTQQAANERIDTLMTQFVKRDPPPNRASDNLAWAAHMNALKHSAEEIVLAELIYE